MSAGKNLLRRAVAVALEAGGYNAGGTVTYPGDAFHVHEDVDVKPQYQFDGARQGTSAGSSMQQSDAKQGRYMDVVFQHRVHPPGAAYSTTNVPTIDRLLRAHGMSKTLVTTGGSEKITYAAVTDPGTWESLFGEVVEGKEKYAYQGGYVYQWTHTADGQGTPVWAFSVKAPLSARVADAALPTITAYPFQTIPSPKGAGSILTINAANGTGSFQGKVRKSTVKSVRTIDDLMSQALAMTGTASGHAGHQLGKYMQTLECTVEATNLAASYSSTTLLDPERMMEEANLATIVLGFNQSVQYGRYKFLSATSGAQIVGCDKGKAGSVPTWDLTINLNPTSDVADDGLSVVFD